MRDVENFCLVHSHTASNIWQLWKVNWGGTSFLGLRWIKLYNLFYLTLYDKMNEISPTAPISYNFCPNKKCWNPGLKDETIKHISFYCPFNYHACFAWVLRAPLSSSSFLALIKSQNGPRAHKKIILTIHCYNSIKNEDRTGKHVWKKREACACEIGERKRRGGSSCRLTGPPPPTVVLRKYRERKKFRFPWPNFLYILQSKQA